MIALLLLTLTMQLCAAFLVGYAIVDFSGLRNAPLVVKFTPLTIMILYVLARRRLQRQLVKRIATCLESAKSEVCLECGYQLTGIRDVGACPECGVHYEIAEVPEIWRKTLDLARTNLRMRN
jgi:uncharacterized paraquat-inducible protein A